GFAPLPQARPAADRPEDDLGLAGDVVGGHEAVAVVDVVPGGVGRGVAVVAHHPHVARGHGDIEGVLARRVLLVDVVLLEGDTVDLQLCPHVLAHHTIAGHADQTLDQVVLGRVLGQTDHAEHHHQPHPGRRVLRGVPGDPVSGVLEHDNIAAMQIEYPVGQIGYQDLVVVVHGRVDLARGDVDRQDQDRLAQDRYQQRDRHGDPRVQPQRHA